MRDYHFLRTPIRGDHQARLVDLEVGEAPLAGDPAPAQVYPQTLELSFEVAPTVTEVQIAPLWEGELIFLADSTAGNPATPADVTPAAYPSWSVTGDLVLRTVAGTAGFEYAIRYHLPLIGGLPSTVRYSKVELTEDFLFTTLSEAAPSSLVFDGGVVDAADPEFHAKLVIAFLAGTAAMPCLQPNPDDSSQDTALKPMPAVVLAPSGSRTVLRVAVASVSEKVPDLAWFDQRPEYDDVSGEQLADPALRTDLDVRYNPSHPGHSAIPARAIFQDAALAAYAPDHDVGIPVRVALTAPRPDGLTYRRIDLERPPIPGAPVGSAPRRPYPQYRLCWTPTGGQPTESLRIPMSGHAYLPLADGSYTFWALPRSQDPSVHLPGDQLMLSLAPQPPARAIGLPQPTVDVDVTGLETARVYAHLRPYDSLYVWAGYEAVDAVRDGLMARAKADWNAEVFKWHILPTTEAVSASYAPVYGYIRESAGRHGLAPEFLLTIAMGEGVNLKLEDAIEAHQPFDPLESIDAFNFAGLDLILYRTGGLMPDGTAPPVPPEIPSTAVDELAEYAYNLVTEGYVDPATAAAVTWSAEIRRTEGATRTIQVATIAGWAAAFELVAAELHARLDEMVAYLAAKVPPVPVTGELERRFLSYIRFNASPSGAQGHADNLAAELRRWPGPPPGNNLNALFNTIQRIAVTQWHERAGIYR